MGRLPCCQDVLPDNLVKSLSGDDDMSCTLVCTSASMDILPVSAGG